MPMLKVYLTEEEARTTRRYARVDGRPVSNFIRHAIAVHIQRSKKKDESGEVIVFPKKV